MDATTDTTNGGHGQIVAVEGLLGRLLGRPEQPQPAGRDREQFMRVTALQIEGIPIRFTTYRVPDITGRRPVWYEFTHNVGDVDTVPVGYPMGPRHYRVPGVPVNTDPGWPYS